ncbi:MAG: hypothetical protein Q8P18_22630 [Pseudomonadota bacterium]|nr:hypothetical protein [Pseudomonadota bacterium]
MLSLSEGDSVASKAFLLPVDIGAALDGEVTGGGTFLAAVAGTWRDELGEGCAVVASAHDVDALLEELREPNYPERMPLACNIARSRGVGVGPGQLLLFSAAGVRRALRLVGGLRAVRLRDELEAGFLNDDWFVRPGRKVSVDSPAATFFAQLEYVLKGVPDELMEVPARHLLDVLLEEADLGRLCPVARWELLEKTGHPNVLDEAPGLVWLPSNPARPSLLGFHLSADDRSIWTLLKRAARDGVHVKRRSLGPTISSRYALDRLVEHGYLTIEETESGYVWHLRNDGPQPGSLAARGP